jgi:hypothetical protein
MGISLRLRNIIAATVATRQRPARLVVSASALSRSPAYGSAGQARLAVCDRMTSAALWRRLNRGTWSATSRNAANTVLRQRAEFARRLGIMREA